MKQVCICLIVLLSAAGYGQENTIPGVLTLAVKEAQGWATYKPGTPDFSYYNRNFNGVFRQNNYTSDILDRRMNMVYVDTDKFYSNMYVPIVLQQHQTNLATDNFYRYEKMYALPDQPAKR